MISRDKAVATQLLIVKHGFKGFVAAMFREQYGQHFIFAEHHLIIINALEKVLKGVTKRLIINIAPRYGKTEIAVKLFMAYGIYLNAQSKFIHLSYADDLALDNSEAVKTVVNNPLFQAIAPQVKIKRGSDSKKKWYTEQGGGVYATSTGGQVTGFGAGRVEAEADEQDEADLLNALETIDEAENFAGCLIIDDPIKPEDADSELKRNRVNERYDSTIKNRVNSRNTPIIIIMQRLHENDLCGHLISTDGENWEVLSLPVIKEDGTALWEHKHTLEELRRMETLNPVVFQRQYMQKPMPRKGMLYSPFRTYKEIPIAETLTRKAYIDTADTGKDYLCCLLYTETEFGMYVQDIYYTQDSMETTEVETAKRIAGHNTRYVKIESNNGGRGFARTVEKNVRLLRNNTATFQGFTQTENKQVRIFTNSAAVTNLIYMPEGWQYRFPIFYKHVTEYLAAGGNAHDDAEDGLTGMVEDFGNSAFGEEVISKEFLGFY